MKLSRREYLRLALATGVGMLSGCSVPLRRALSPAPPVQILKTIHDLPSASRWLNRVTFGVTPTELDSLAELGKIAYLEQQLHPNDEGEEWLVRLRLRGFEIIRTSPVELGDLPYPEVLRQLPQHAILRAVYSKWQLRERMVDFWRDHFNVYALKANCAYFLPQFEQDVLRKHALGRFPELLQATAHSPAMLYYLDNAANRRGVPNENYARELMELHTLGVHGGYTQRDVQEVARCFTGWTVEERFLRPRGKFRFEASWYDDAPKHALGERMTAGGKADGERVLRMLAIHPSTAKHLCAKLCVHFIGHAPEETVHRLSEVYLDTGGDISNVLRELLLSDQFLQSPLVFKRPFDYMVSALRAVYALTDGNLPLQEHLQKMGQPLYQWPLPDGYPHGEATWKGTLLARWNFAIALCSNQIRGTWVDLHSLASTEKPSETLLQTLLCLPPDAPTLRPLREKLHGALAQQAALILASPQFQWR